MSKFQTICKIPLEDGARCGHVIVQSKEPMQLPEIGQSTPDRSKQFVQAIVQHVAKKHPEFTGLMMNVWEQFLGHQAIGFTDTDDPNVPMFMARFTEYLAKVSIVPVSDEAIETIVGRMSFTQSDPHRVEVIQGMKYLRDFMARKGIPG